MHLRAFLTSATVLAIAACGPASLPPAPPLPTPPRAAAIDCALLPGDGLAMTVTRDLAGHRCVLGTWALVFGGLGI